MKMKNELEQVRHGLELDEDIQLASKSYPIQRVGWFILYAFLLFALLGYFGKGIVSEKKSVVDDKEIRYEKFGRNQMPMNLELIIPQIQDSIIISIPQEYFNYVQLRSVNPQPSKQEINDRSYNFTFQGKGELRAYVEVEPKIYGSINFTVTAGGTSIPVTQYFYP
jgi:hypothetical protein